jgi:hypothetical protein
VQTGNQNHASVQPTEGNDQGLSSETASPAKSLLESNA